MAGAFEEFCAAGLWPGLGRTTAARLAAAGVVDAALVSAERLATVDGVTANRAARLAKSWAGAAPLFAVAELLHPAGVPLRFSPPVVSDLGDGAARRLAADPWLFLDVDGVTPGEADRLALATLDPR
ncbi:MAG TPA: hypothetical protein VNE21_00290, partial [Mycobacteriales bacterium]|nr:hypothetical protein [Mycobacteriales bacterium]